MASETTTEGELCSIALLNIGQRQGVDDLDENTEEAAACKAYYGACRDLLLRKYPWKFAKLRSTLALRTETRSGWLYAYGVPGNCIAPLRIWNGDRMPDAESKIPFTTEAYETNGEVAGQLLLTDQPAAELIYTARVKAVALFPPDFVEALVWLLATRLVLALPVKPSVATMAAEMAKSAFREAIASQGRYDQPDVEPESSYITGR